MGQGQPLPCCFDYPHCEEAGSTHVRLVLGFGASTLGPCNWVCEAAGTTPCVAGCELCQAVTGVGGRPHVVCMCAGSLALAAV